jgi:hypothetical protein
MARKVRIYTPPSKPRGLIWFACYRNKRAKIIPEGPTQ